MAWIEAKKIGDDFTSYMIQESDFDPTIYRYLTEDEKEKARNKSIEFNNLLKSERNINIGFSMGKSGASHSPYYNGKLDSGATEELIDQGLEGAKNRGLEREKDNGKAFNRANQKYYKED